MKQHIVLDTNPIISALIGGASREVFSGGLLSSLHLSTMKDKIKEAEGLIRHIDEKDVDIPALALKLNVPLWTNDRHFSGIRR